MKMHSRKKCFVQVTIVCMVVGLCTTACGRMRRLVSPQQIIKEALPNPPATTLPTAQPVEGQPIFYSLSSHPDSVAVGVKTELVFTIMMAGTETKPDTITVEQIDQAGTVIAELGPLVDDGSQGDLSANDYVFSGTYSVQHDEEGTLHFRMKASFNGMLEPFYSDVYPLSVTDFPIGVSPFDVSKVVDDPNTGGQIISNVVLVAFVDGTSPDKIRSIVESVDGKVIGSIIGLGIYEVEIPDTGDAAQVYKAIEQLLQYPEVRYAEPNSVEDFE